MSGPAIRSVLAGTAGLFVLLAAAILLTLARPRISPMPAVRRRCLVLLALAVAGQCTHFAEELLTGFHTRFPVALGLIPWTSTFFIAVNVCWLAIWGLSAFGLQRGLVAALAPAWFLALALLLNGVAHPLLAVREGAYFPGLYSSPLVFVLGLLLFHALFALSRLHPRVA